MEKEKDTILLLKESLELLKKYGEIAIKKDYELEKSDLYFLNAIKHNVDFMIKNL